VVSGAATVYGLFADKRLAVFGFIGFVFAIVLLVLVQRAIQQVGKPKAKLYDSIVLFFVIFVLAYFIALSVALFPHLVRWLTVKDQP
jgi:hypothetical protein